MGAGGSSHRQLNSRRQQSDPRGAGGQQPQAAEHDLGPGALGCGVRPLLPVVQLFRRILSSEADHGAEGGGLPEVPRHDVHGLDHFRGDRAEELEEDAGVGDRLPIPVFPDVHHLAHVRFAEVGVEEPSAVEHLVQ